ncbi:MAG: helix-turn-helix domain-containing protein [Candidatus Omnitrophota bacterium]
MAKVKVLKLNPKDQKKLKELTRSGTLKSRKLNRCRILLLSAEKKTKKEIAKILNMSPVTVIETCKRYREGDLNTALNEKPRPGAPGIFNGKQKAKITALACTKAPKGAARWSLRLLADKAIELKIVEDISYETVGVILKKTNLSLT